MSALDSVLARLKGVKMRDGQIMARCPSHDDHAPSLSIKENSDGAVILHCFAGCRTEDILDAIGLRMADLFPQTEGGGGGNKIPKRTRTHVKGGESPAIQGKIPSVTRTDDGSNSTVSPPDDTPPAPVSFGCTLDAYAEAKKLPLDFLKRIGLTQFTYLGNSAVRIPYRITDGTTGAARYRIATTGDDKFRWKKGDKPFLYGLERIHEARAAGFVLLVEGESDSHTAWFHNLPAVGIPGAANWREERDAAHFDGVPVIYVTIEPDAGGEAVRAWLARSSIRERVWLVHLPTKDLSALHIQHDNNPAAFRAALDAALDAAELWSQREQEERDAATKEALAVSDGLLDDPTLIPRVRNAITAGGYAGSTDQPVIAYLALTSRLLERPLNLAFISQAASGKNKTVDAAVGLMPEEAIYRVDAGSARALIYSDDDFAHRIVYFGERDSIPEDGPAASAVRSIITNGYMTYDVVEQNPQTGRYETRHITKEGPTGLITTGVKSFGAQFDSRVLEIPIPDDEEQTRKVLRTIASRRMTSASPPDLTRFIAAQRWLSLAGERHVLIPYADHLAEHISAKAVRMRRDFTQLLTAIETVAFLHQRQRERTETGAIIATGADYACVRDLLAPIFTTIIAEGCTPAVRATVAAIAKDEEVSGAELARRLNLARTTVSDRVQRALRGGWLVNKETQQGRSARYVIGAPLPEETDALPSLDGWGGVEGRDMTEPIRHPYSHPSGISPVPARENEQPDGYTGTSGENIPPPPPPAPRSTVRPDIPRVDPLRPLQTPEQTRRDALRVWVDHPDARIPQVAMQFCQQYRLTYDGYNPYATAARIKRKMAEIDAQGGRAP